MIPTLQFGRTAHRSTRVLFGGAAFKKDHGSEEAERGLQALLEHGVNHIDTARSYGGGNSETLIGTWMREHRERFFLATKTGERTREGAEKNLAISFKQLQIEQIDLIQMHGLTDEEGWQTAMGPNGALEALEVARNDGRVRFIGVTGHGLVTPKMHLRSLERFPFDSVLLPYNWPLHQDGEYYDDVQQLLEVCTERQVAVQIIKSIARRPWGERERTRDPWYEPLEEAEDIQRAVDFVFGLGHIFINAVSDLNVLPLILEAAGNPGPRPADDEMAEMALRTEMETIFEQREPV